LFDNDNEEGRSVDAIRKLYVAADRLARGQTMTEYIMIVSTIAIVVFAGYTTLGTTLSAMLNSVDNLL
jgi:Flp pilus assembly pilin Flp